MIYKFISFLLMFFSPAVVDEIAKRVISKQPDRTGGAEFYSSGNMLVTWWSSNVEITLNQRLVRRTTDGLYRPGFWVFRLWWAL